ncbi:hypothetical protein [Parvibaculum sp.]|uniref:hypothetical protein n=1 Tax=Parvibaculum sp. TaxID=2024848 RepID=UPI0026328536|nr:hypothetical protein [Parvibaculum sp.]MCW5725864.1 hypothetical protein [Parvibaculum sp.]
MATEENPYMDFTSRLKLFISKHPELITTTLSNIFTMRLIGNKTHGDLAEIAIAEFINQYMYDFRSLHVGKDLYRAKSREEDITITNEITKAQFPVSLKAYGDGPLQLSTDKNTLMYPRLLKEGDDVIQGKKRIEAIFDDPAFSVFSQINVLPLIYDEKRQRCNILVFDYEAARSQTTKITRADKGSGRKHPVFRFYDVNDEYICEVRYGDATANALQRGLWTHTRNALKHFDSVTGGWVDYSHNLVLVKLFSHALVSSSAGHESALIEVKKDIDRLKKSNSL